TYRYLVLAKATDVAGNTQNSFGVNVSSTLFMIDRTAPSAVVTPEPTQGASYKPINIGKLASATHFRGTSSDPNSGAGVALVQLRLSYIAGGNTYYWDGSANAFSSYSVTASTAWMTTSGTLGWNYNKDILWPTDASHAMVLEVRAED